MGEKKLLEDDFEFDENIEGTFNIFGLCEKYIKAMPTLDSSVKEGVIKTDYAKMQNSKILEDNKGRNFKLKGKIDAYKEGNVWYTSKNAVNSYMVNRKRQRKN